MSLVAQLYDMSMNEAMSLSQKEVDYLTDAAITEMALTALKSEDMKAIMRQRLEPTLRSFRSSRGSGTSTSGIGAPPSKES